jgi:P4 family phage/plasmid primase-like protien
MLKDLASQLGVSPASLTQISIGWLPIEACWTFPERDAQGEVVGIIRRFKNGKKVSITGGKRGLTYPLAEAILDGQLTYTPGSQNWTKASSEFPCPICGHSDWCLVSSENPADPKAVICGRKAEGAKVPLGDAGYLHIRKAEGLVYPGSPLALSELPVLVVEGQSDVAAAYDLGFVAVGKPAASGGLGLLCDLLIGREVVILGENDSGAGRLGMEKTFEALKPKIASLRKLMPPGDIKDLRSWLQRGLTHELLLKVIEEHGDKGSATTLLESTAPLDLAERWLQENHTSDGLVILRRQHATWFRFSGQRYEEIASETSDATELIRGGIYGFLKGKTQKKILANGDVNIEKFIATSHHVSDIIDAATHYCPIRATPPCWLDDEEHPSPQNLISFTNGLLNLSTYELIPATPKFFSVNCMPYNFESSAKCPLWVSFLQQIFPDDKGKIWLLQEWFGYCMVADMSQEKLMFFVGRPGAGKGTVLEALRAVIGTKQVASTSFDSLVSDFGLKPLIGKLAAILPDASITKRGDPMKALQVIKEISGGDAVSINRKNKDHLEDYKLTCRFTIAVNSLPDLPDHERSLDRRLLLIPFNESFIGREDTTLKHRIIQEVQGIATWALNGLRRLRSQGHFTLPTTSAPVIEQFRRQSSPITEFADEFCTFGSHEVPTAMLYDAYAKWAKDQGIMAGTHCKFSQRLSSLYPGVICDKMTFQGKQVRCYKGLALTEEAVERFLLGRRT